MDVPKGTLLQLCDSQTKPLVRAEGRTERGKKIKNKYYVSSAPHGEAVGTAPSRGQAVYVY